MIRRCSAWLQLMVMTLAILAVTLGAGHHVGAAAEASADGGEKHYRVEVSREGFKVLDGGGMTARAGERVTITFVYGDGDLEYDNPHQIFFPSLNLKSEAISQANPESTVSFVASQEGEIPLKCINQCNGHKQLQQGFLMVSSGGVQAVATRLSLKAAPADEGMELSASLQTQSGEPVGGSQVVFFQEGEFLGTESIRIRDAITGSDGIARIPFQPRREGEVRLSAVFAGSPAWQPSDGAAVVAVPDSAVVHYEFEPRGMKVPGLGRWLMWLAFAVVWTAYGITVWSAARIPRLALSGPGIAIAGNPILMANSAARQADSQSKSHGGGSAWTPQEPDAMKEAGSVDRGLWKLAVGMVALLLVVTWGFGSYRSSREREARVAAEAEVRGNLATVAQGLQELQTELKPALNRQSSLEEALAELTAALAAQQTVPAAQAPPRADQQSAPVAQTRPPSSTTQSEAAPAEPAPRVVQVDVTAFHFGWDPSIITVDRGDTVRLVITNDNTILSPGVPDHPSDKEEWAHGFGIEEYGIDTEEIQPGQQAVVEFVADKAGEFEIVCTIWCGLLIQADGSPKGHPNMLGTLIVQ